MWHRLALGLLFLICACGKSTTTSPQREPVEPHKAPEPSLRSRDPIVGAAADAAPADVNAPASGTGCGSGCATATDVELAAHHQRTANAELDRDCIGRVTGIFAGAIVVGTFAHDRGCRAEGVHHACCYHTPVLASDEPMLQHAGWTAASPQRRHELALTWTDAIANAFEGRFLASPTPHFGKAKKQFAAPSATSDPAGGVIVRGWMREPPGMINEARYTWSEHRFDVSGAHVGWKRLDGFAVPGGS